MKVPRPPPKAVIRRASGKVFVAAEPRLSTLSMPVGIVVEDGEDKKASSHPKPRRGDDV